MTAVEVRLNQSEFEYFKRTRYYDACRQLEDTREAVANFEYLPDTGSPGLPDWARQGAVEIKTSWRILDKTTDIPGRYFTTRASYLKPNGDVSPPLTLGLVGMHILRNTPRSKSTWAWATFEQVDNVRILDRPVPMRPSPSPTFPVTGNHRSVHLITQLSACGPIGPGWVCGDSRAPVR